MKAVLPVASVLLAGVMVFVGVTLSIEWRARERVLLVAASGAVVVCAVMLVVLAVLIQRPLAELRKKMARVRAGDLTVSVSFADQHDEIGDLGKDFNKTVRQLREGREEIERLHQTQMSKAEHLATLGELAAGLAHEIRNPLAGIAGVIDVIKHDLPESSPGRGVLHEVREEVLHIQNVLSDLLAYARPKPAQTHNADLNATAEHAVSLARQQVLSQPIQIDLTKGEGLEAVVHDPGQIQQVLLNLLLNAIQATEGRGLIQVGLDSREGFARVRVRDNGRGIAAENLPNIFRPFFTTKGQGTGLGLSLAWRIVEAHGGRIEVASAPAQGCEFTVLLPLDRGRARGAVP